jgi:hypothetical protein
MHLDVRKPMGWLFLLLGLILLGSGFLNAPATGPNLNLPWGAVFTLFGGINLWLSRRAN